MGVGVKPRSSRVRVLGSFLLLWPSNLTKSNLAGEKGYTFGLHFQFTVKSGQDLKQELEAGSEEESGFSVALGLAQA